MKLKLFPIGSLVSFTIFFPGVPALLREVDDATLRPARDATTASPATIVVRNTLRR